MFSQLGKLPPTPQENGQTWESFCMENFNTALSLSLDMEKGIVRKEEKKRMTLPRPPCTSFSCPAAFVCACWCPCCRQSVSSCGNVEQPGARYRLDRCFSPKKHWGWLGGCHRRISGVLRALRLVKTSLRTCEDIFSVTHSVWPGTCGALYTTETAPVLGCLM